MLHAIRVKLIIQSVAGYKDPEHTVQLTRIVVSPSLLIYDLLIPLTKFLNSCIETGWKFTVFFLLSLLYFNINLFITSYNTCYKPDHPRSLTGDRTTGDGRMVRYLSESRREFFIFILFIFRFFKNIYHNFFCRSDLLSVRAYHLMNQRFIRRNVFWPE